MLPFLSLHALAAQRGDGLRPELLALFERHARSGAGLVATIEPVETALLDQVMDVAARDPAKQCRTGDQVASLSYHRDIR